MSFWGINKINYEELYKKELYKNEDLRTECLYLHNENKKLIIELSELNEELRKSNNKYLELENRLKSFHPNLKPIQKKVTYELKEQVKQMVHFRMTYREISKKMDISIKTISRIMNGYYDK